MDVDGTGRAGVRWYELRNDKDRGWELKKARRSIFKARMAEKRRDSKVLALLPESPAPDAIDP